MKKERYKSAYRKIVNRQKAVIIKWQKAVIIKRQKAVIKKWRKTVNYSQ